MSDKGIEPSGHRLMQENVATYLAHRPKGAELPTGRWETKLQRDLKDPYSDDRVTKHIDQLQNSLLENLKQLPSYPSEIYVTGSFAKGRLSPHCDLNGYAVLPSDQFDPAFQNFQRRFDESESDVQANLFPMSESSPGFNKAMLMVEGTSLLIPTARLKEEGYLRSVYSDLLHDKSDSRLESKPSTDGIVGKMWRSKFERETFHFKAMRGALHLGGTLARIPLLGSLVKAGVGRVIRQSHQNLTGR